MHYFYIIGHKRIIITGSWLIVAYIVKCFFNEHTFYCPTLFITISSNLMFFGILKVCAIYATQVCIGGLIFERLMEFFCCFCNCFPLELRGIPEDNP